MYSNTFKPICNLVKVALLTGAFIFSESSNLWASGAPELTEAEKQIVQRVSNYENAGFTQSAIKLEPEDQRILTYFGVVLGCDMPIIEALYHVMKSVTLDEYKVYQGLIKKNPNLLNSLHEDLRAPMGVLVEQNLSGTELNFFHKQFKAIPSGIVNYTHLTMLNLSYNQLTHLPAEIGQLAALKKLDLSGNQLTHLPAEIGQLAALKELDLLCNQLTHLPVEIGQLSALEELCLSKNQLTHLPVEIGQLSALESLYLSINQLTYLPVEIGQLSALERIYLTSNPLLDGLDISTAVQGYVNGADHIRDMFRGTTNILFTMEQFWSKAQIFGTRE